MHLVLLVTLALVLAPLAQAQPPSAAQLIKQLGSPNRQLHRHRKELPSGRSLLPRETGELHRRNGAVNPEARFSPQFHQTHRLYSRAPARAAGPTHSEEIMAMHGY